MKNKGGDTFDKPLLILCEGESDRMFFNKLLVSMNLMDKFHVKFPGRENESTGGNKKFGWWINNSLDTSLTFKNNVKGILVITDSDGNSVTAFKDVCETLKPFGNRLAVPLSQQVVKKINGQPAICIATIPIAGTGTLETLCLISAYAKWPHLKLAISDLLTAANINGWQPTKKEKMQIQTIIACTCESRPEAGLAKHWEEDAKFHIPVTDRVFDDIRKIIDKFMFDVFALD